MPKKRKGKKKPGDKRTRSMPSSKSERKRKGEKYSKITNSS